MPKKQSKTVDAKELSAMTTESSDDKPKKKTSVVDNSEVSPKKKSQRPKVMSLDDLESFDPSATHEDLSEDDDFDDEDDI